VCLFPDGFEGTTAETRNGLSQRPQPDQLYAGYKQWVSSLWFLELTSLAFLLSGIVEREDRKSLIFVIHALQYYDGCEDQACLASHCLQVSNIHALSLCLKLINFVFQMLPLFVPEMYTGITS
jgi:hypothetical protein